MEGQGGRSRVPRDRSPGREGKGEGVCGVYERERSTEKEYEEKGKLVLAKPLVRPAILLAKLINSV